MKHLALVTQEADFPVQAFCSCGKQSSSEDKETVRGWVAEHFMSLDQEDTADYIEVK